ncbi:hydrolase 1, exosortase A system-associated [Ectothiorhodospira sp. BSL-9]|uniref:hydrolase 1, exosortase A system-associated n=1 Tax=Ectothiorhodospira sp. BSL-9 TaxID=1442136 RepID=UPI0007B43A87|nr:hydrolase 1, exosortase A system-associated [Ectothiorhodospira sp. BSL-9]ANB02207.1 hydrolase [Ectothiorhodospira sp. BSL-9]
MMEQVVNFPVQGEELLGVLHRPEVEPLRQGVLIVVGGPQYRVGSHRQFVLLARHLEANGVAAMRFDYRGMGDASGDQRDFEDVDEDIKAAIDAFLTECPELDRVVIWGLCGAASGGLTYAWRDPRVSGLILLNPWVRTEEGLAKAYLKHYYLQRLFSRSLWADLLRGRLNPITSLHSILQLARRALGRKSAGGGDPGAATQDKSQPLPDRMAEGWRRFQGDILVILSGEDLTAAEFRDTAAQAPAWDGLLADSRVEVKELRAANHTFSRQEWRAQVERWTLQWVQRRASGGSSRSAPVSMEKVIS